MSRPWCRLYTGTRNHRKIRILRKQCPKTWTYWYVLIELAGEIDDGGWIYLNPDQPYDDKTLAKELGFVQERSWKRLRNALETLKLITVNEKGLLVNSFSERNFESDVSTPRVHKYRERLKQKKVVETFQETVTETDQNRTEQNRTYINAIPPFYTCEFFDVFLDFRNKLMKEYPLLTDALLLKEFSKMEDWLSDNRKKKKFKANGHLANPKLFIKNWLDKNIINPQPIETQNMDFYMDNLEKRVLAKK